MAVHSLMHAAACLVSRVNLSTRAVLVGLGAVTWGRYVRVCWSHRAVHAVAFRPRLVYLGAQCVGMGCIAIRVTRHCHVMTSHGHIHMSWLRMHRRTIVGRIVWFVHT
jgi:hypothetical protein